MEHKSNCDANCNPCAQYSHQRIEKGTGRIGNKNSSGNHPNDNTVKISENTEKSPDDLRKLAVSETPVKNYQLMLVWKTLIRGKIIVIIYRF